MKIASILFTVFLSCSSLLLTSQNPFFVTADNGLTVREQPDPKARRVGKLNYGEVINVIETTNINLAIFDEGEQIEGQWVKMQSPTIKGYVFNGFLSPEKLEEPIELRHYGLTMRLKNLKTNDEFKRHTLHDKDTIRINVALGDSPEGKIITINNKGYKHISIFQQFENSVTIMNEGPHCDLTEWKHYYSSWEPLQAISKTKFKTLQYSSAQRRQFMDIDINQLKTEVENKCGKDWRNYVNDITTVNDFPADIGISRIFLKVLLTNENDEVTEKIIEFQIPMGC
ncbi:SH3 domain-containing protein [uncultured Winogradskyella sp.]|uniref:SH3 domain-containing protein n=1 Tax=uncultured Winogradskyella sp. TaxID=395353 RepID=UPI003514322E